MPFLPPNHLYRIWVLFIQRVLQTTFLTSWVLLMHLLHTKLQVLNPPLIFLIIFDTIIQTVHIHMVYAIFRPLIILVHLTFMVEKFCPLIFPMIYWNIRFLVKVFPCGDAGFVSHHLNILMDYFLFKCIACVWRGSGESLLWRDTVQGLIDLRGVDFATSWQSSGHDSLLIWVFCSLYLADVQFGYIFFWQMTML